MKHWPILEFLPSIPIFLAVLSAAVSMVVIWRLRGILMWKYSLRNELKRLENELETADDVRRRALTKVQEQCRKTWQTVSPEFNQLADLAEYIRSIAACYHPTRAKPELCITLGRLLTSASAFADRLAVILNRSGFKSLKKIRIRHIRRSYEWYNRLNQFRVIRYLNRYRKMIARISRLRLVILPDPFLWIAYLSNRLSVLILTRCLLMEIYLFIGELAVKGYDEKDSIEPVSIEMDNLEQTLIDLDASEISSPDVSDPKIREIRNRLVGVVATVVSTPGLEDWKKAVQETALLIAEKYFPDSERPLEEAALGPILERGRVWIDTVCKVEKFPVANRFYRVKIESLVNLKSFADGLMSDQVRAVAKTSWHMYRFTKWPLRTYRWLKKGSPLGLAMGIGWVMAKKGFINLICRHTFDAAHKELEMIYNRSSR